MLRVCLFGQVAAEPSRSARLAGSAGGGVGVLIPLVARAGVLAEAGSVLTAARAGRGALLTITGEPGIGKTRLAEEAAERAGEFEVVWTWGAVAGGAALGPWSRTASPGGPPRGG